MIFAVFFIRFRYLLGRANGFCEKLKIVLRKRILLAIMKKALKDHAQEKERTWNLINLYPTHC